MSSFKEIKKKSNIKVFENKLKRLYASDNLLDEDIKYLNLQFDLYTIRKNYINLFSFACALLTYNFFYIRELQRPKRLLITSFVGYMVYISMRSKNRYHFESVICPYLEKYYIK